MDKQMDPRINALDVYAEQLKDIVKTATNKSDAFKQGVDLCGQLIANQAEIYKSALESAGTSGGKNLQFMQIFKANDETVAKEMEGITAMLESLESIKHNIK